jgi:hypothetical protein
MKTPRTAPAGRQAQPGHFMNIVVDTWRHALPLVWLYLFHGNIASYLLLTAFDLSLGLMLIVGTTRDRSDPTTVDPRSRSMIARWAAVLLIAIFLAIVAAILTLPIGLPAFFFGLSAGVDWWGVLAQHGFWISVASMSLFAGMRAQDVFEATTTIGNPAHAAPVVGNLDQDRSRSLADNAAQVTLIGTFVFLSYALITLGRPGFYAFPILYAAIVVFYDARPDLAGQIFPDLWRATP